MPKNTAEKMAVREDLRTKTLLLVCP